LRNRRFDELKGLVNTDEFTKRRLLDLAAKYDKRLTAAGPSAATRIRKAPFDLKEAPKHI
jgi:hypothetical protein